ncbi:MAG: sporulation protein YqfD [Syntrophomonadaceae bacterium]|jgi:similar to stage IV sporulation protein
MANKLFDQVGGIITVKLRGKNEEKVINMALTRGIFLWDIKKDADGMKFKVRTSGFKAIKNIADENNFELTTVASEGLPFYRNLFKRRMGFFGGALIFVLALYLVTSFVWFVDVSGNHNVDTKRIILTAAKYGVYQGAAKWNFSCNEAEEGMLRDISQLSYAEINVKGVKAHIKVVEKILPKRETTGPCHMVAIKDGVVEDVLVLEGQANTKKGDVVGKGDILISGVVFPQKQEQFIEDDSSEPRLPYEVRARGVVKARVWYDGYSECKLRSEKTLFTGRKKTVVYLQTPWQTITILGKGDTDYRLYEKKFKKHTLTTPVGEFSIKRLTLLEQTRSVKEYTESEAVNIARKKAEQELRKKLGPSQKITDSKVEVVSSPSDPIIRVKVSVETIENIAIDQPINTSGNGN